jgi:isopenicillin-N N-acyltransferase-like protein
MTYQTHDPINFSGGPHDIGYAYGTACSQLIAEIVDASLSYYRKYCDLNKTAILRAANKFHPFIIDYAPRIGEEIAGISEGSERSLEEILLLVASYEMFTRHGGGGVGCTSVAVTGAATANGETFVGQTLDEAFEPWGENFSRIVHVTPRSGPKFVQYAYPGFPGQMGLNSCGIALCSNTLVSGEHRFGVPFQVIAHEILQQKSIGEALNAITRAKRATSVNFLISDENGEIYDIETTPRSYDCFYSNERMVHTNHFLSAKLDVRRDVFLECLNDTMIRYNRMTRLLRNMPQESTLQHLMDAFKDHVNYPNSICRHPDETQPPKDRMRTADCMIFSTTRKTIWFCKGNPCQTGFQKLEIS